MAGCRKDQAIAGWNITIRTTMERNSQTIFRLAFCCAGPAYNSARHQFTRKATGIPPAGFEDENRYM